MDEHHCISNSLWLDYSLNKLSQTDIDRIQNHVVICEICADVKQGIDAMANPETLGQTVDTLNYKVGKFNKQRHSITLVWYWSAAALVVFGIGFSLYFMNRPTELALEMIENTSKNSSLPENQIDSLPSISLLQEKPLVKTVSPTTIHELTVREDLNVKDHEINKAIVLNLGHDIKRISTPEALSQSAFSVTDTNRYNLAMETKTNMDDSYSETPVAESDEQVSRTLETVQIVSTESRSIKKMNSKRAPRKAESLPAPFNNSSGLNNSILLKNEAFGDSLEFVKANTAYTQGKYEQSLALLQIISTNSESIYYEDAMMLKAKILIYQGHKTEARASLKSVISKKGKRIAEANELLNTLN